MRFNQCDINTALSENRVPKNKRVPPYRFLILLLWNIICGINEASFLVISESVCLLEGPEMGIDFIVSHGDYLVRSARLELNKVITVITIK